MRAKLAAVALIGLAGCTAGTAKSIPDPVLAPEVTPSTTAFTEPVATTEVVVETTIAVAPTGPVTRQQTSTPTVPITIPTRSSELSSIRACESGGDYTTNTGNGYYGAYQFSLSTWASVGGTGNPANASVAEQDMRAQIMIDSGRRGEWPNC